MKNIKIIYEGVGIRWGFHGGTVVKNPPASEEMRFDPWVRQFPWRRKMAPHSSTLAWRIPWTEEPGGLQSMGSQRVRHEFLSKTK